MNNQDVIILLSQISYKIKETLLYYNAEVLLEKIDKKR